MTRSWLMLSSVLALLVLGTQCTDDESGEGIGRGGAFSTGGRIGSGGRIETGGDGGERPSSGGTSLPGGGAEGAGAGGAYPAGAGGVSPGGTGPLGGAGAGDSGNGGSGGVWDFPPACVLSGEAGAEHTETCCWKCDAGEPCRHLECGNGKVDWGCLIPFQCYQVLPGKPINGPYYDEECDDGNLIDGDGCSSDCNHEYPDSETCGNGGLDPLEECDDGNLEADDGCDEQCQLSGSAICSVAGEPCIWNVCGDGLAGNGQCDDGNTASGDGCSELCDVELNWTCPPEGACEEAYCGNSSVDEFTEDDDDGFAGAWNVRGQLIRREDCDDGNQISGDGCSARCRLEEGWNCAAGGPCHRLDCGDGFVFVPGEQCDDGNDESGDGCDEACKIEVGWVCQRLRTDDGNGGSGGNGGNGGDAQPVRDRPSTCSLSECGDGFLSREGEEQCDDGNRRSGDGCSSDCEIEGEECTILTDE